MASRLACLAVALCAGVGTGVAYPYLDLALACRNPFSEACVWGKAFFSLTMGVSLVLVNGVTTGVVYGLLRWRSDRGSAHQQGLAAPNQEPMIHNEEKT